MLQIFKNKSLIPQLLCLHNAAIYSFYFKTPIFFKMIVTVFRMCFKLLDVFYYNSFKFVYLLETIHQPLTT